LSRTVSKLLQIIGQICANDRELSPFYTLVRGIILNSLIRNLISRSSKHPITLS